MPVRRALELRVKALADKVLGVLYHPAGHGGLSSFLYEWREKGSAGVSIMTHLGRLAVVVQPRKSSPSTP